MLQTETGIWNDALNPAARRNTPDNALTVLELHGRLADMNRVCLYASDTSDARTMIAALRTACDEWSAIVDVIEAESATKAEERAVEMEAARG